MSPRAAWQLEVLGFTDVYDYVEGKVEWLMNRLPTEGEGPHYPLVGEAATKEGLHTCELGSSADESLQKMEEGGDTSCLVLNEEGIVLGRIRNKQAETMTGRVVEDVMERGPTTVRPTEPAKALFERMERRKVPEIVVTTKKGELIGVARLGDLRQLIEESG